MALFKKKSTGTKNDALVDSKTTAIDKKQALAKNKEPKKVTKISLTNDYIKLSKEFENTRIGEVEKSRKLAWTVAGVACLTAMLACLAIVFLTPLKEVKPYLVRVDNNTGQTDIVTTLANAKSDYGEEVTKFFAANYVRLVEGYDWYTIQTAYNNALLFSDDNIQNRINNKFSSPSAPHKVYINKYRVNIEIDSISFIGENLLQIRFTRKVVPVDGGRYDTRTNKTTPEAVESQEIATIGYDYVNVPEVDEVRLVNPLGFTVLSYRVDSVRSQKESDNQDTEQNVPPPTPNTDSIVGGF